jgi:hypothetical protein
MLVAFWSLFPKEEWFHLRKEADASEFWIFMTMANSMWMLFILPTLPSCKNLVEWKHHAELTDTDAIALLSVPWGRKKGLIALCDSTSSEELMLKYHNLCLWPSSCPGPQSGRLSKCGRLSDGRAYGTLQWVRSYFSMNITELFTHFRCILVEVRPKKPLHEIFRAFIKS